jgi:hypothetical protein
MANFASAAPRAATVPCPAPSIDASFRPARALIGWMEADEAHQALASGHDGGVTDAMVERAARARRTASTSRKRPSKSVAINDSVSGVGEYLSKFRPTIQQDLDNGWRFATIDLTQLIALQAVTFTDHYAEKTYELQRADTERIAKITLPFPDERQPLIQADNSGHAWIVSSNNPHLQVVEAVQDEGAGVFGFRLGRPTSILKVANIGGLAVCLDGHHRVYQLLRRGIAHAPGIFRSFSSLNDVPQLPPGLFSDKLIRGENPPHIGDLLDNDTSAPVLAPATRKFLLIEARELTLPI